MSFPWYGDPDRRKQKLQNFYCDTLKIRQQFIKATAPFINTAELWFVEELSRRKVVSLSRDSETARQLLFELPCQTASANQSEYLPISAVLHLHFDAWDLPCYKCELLFRPYSLKCGGPRARQWQNFPTCNCAEPLALTLAYGERRRKEIARTAQEKDRPSVEA
jgi:hypothetical protein